MNISRFFIDRPIFAAVIAVFITLIGLFAYPLLPLSQYPEIAPPTITINTAYPGASAETVAETKNRMLALVNQLDATSGWYKDKIRIHFSGCPSSCGQHQIADIGFRGARTKIDGQMTMTKYEEIVLLSLQLLPAIRYQPLIFFTQEMLFMLPGGFTTFPAEIVGQSDAYCRWQYAKQPLTQRIPEYLFQKFVTLVTGAKTISVCN